MKYCNTCKINKPIEDFYKSTGGIAHQCKQCYGRYYAEKWKSDPAYRERQRLRSRKNSLKKNYGLTENDYTQMLESQGGCCAICKATENSIKSKMLAVDHCHDSGKIRGLLCNKCNSMLGQCGDSIQILETAIAYIKTHSSG